MNDKQWHADLARCDGNGEQQQRDPLQRCELALQAGPEQQASGQYLQVAQDLVGSSI